MRKKKMMNIREKENLKKKHLCYVRKKEICYVLVILFIVEKKNYKPHKNESDASLTKIDLDYLMEYANGEKKLQNKKMHTKLENDNLPRVLRKF
jgi:hypothetical protein